MSVPAMTPRPVRSRRDYRVPVHSPRAAGVPARHLAVRRTAPPPRCLVDHIGNNFAGADVQVAGDGGKVPRSSGSFPERARRKYSGVGTETTTPSVTPGATQIFGSVT